MSKIIECQVNDEYILGSGVVIGAAGSIGNVALKLTFNEMWDGLSIMATFKDALSEKSTVVMLSPSMLVDGDVRTYLVPIPEETTKIPGRARLTLTGYSIYSINEGGERTVKYDSLANTSTAFFRVLESDAAIADDGTMTPNLAEQAFAAIDNAEALLLETERILEDVEKAESLRADAEEERQEYYENLRECLEMIEYLQEKMIKAGHSANSVLTSVLDAYPVGAIYMSLKNTSPSRLFGGNWVAIEEGRFLLAAGDTYAAEVEGGSATHKHNAGDLVAEISANIYNPDKQSGIPNGTFLSLNEIKKSTTTNRYTLLSSTDVNVTRSTDEAHMGSKYATKVSGETAEVNNMPPYFAVYMWKRIA